MPEPRKNLNLEKKLILAALVYAAAVFTYTGLDYISKRPPATPKAFVPPPPARVDVPEAPSLPATRLPALPPLPELPKR